MLLTMTVSPLTCRYRQVKGLTVMVNSIYNGYRYEDIWLDR
jgi:peptide/nickel transport system substrate-binding protein